MSGFGQFSITSPLDTSSFNPQIAANVAAGSTAGINAENSLQALDLLPASNPGTEIGPQDINPFDLTLSAIASGGAVTTGGAPAASTMTINWTMIGWLALAFVGSIFLARGFAK